MFTCHRYWSGTDKQSIQDFIDFRDKVNLPMYIMVKQVKTPMNGLKILEYLRRKQHWLDILYIQKWVQKSGMMYIPKPEKLGFNCRIHQKKIEVI